MIITWQKVKKALNYQGERMKDIVQISWVEPDGRCSIAYIAKKKQLRAVFAGYIPHPYKLRDPTDFVVSTLKRCYAWSDTKPFACIAASLDTPVEPYDENY